MLAGEGCTRAPRACGSSSVAEEYVTDGVHETQEADRGILAGQVKSNRGGGRVDQRSPLQRAPKRSRSAGVRGRGLRAQN